MAAKTLASMGYERVEVLVGRLTGWGKAGFAVEREEQQ